MLTTATGGDVLSHSLVGHREVPLWSLTGRKAQVWKEQIPDDVSILIQNTPSASTRSLGSPQDSGQSLSPARAHWHQHLHPRGHPRLTVQGARLKGTTSCVGESIHE